MTSSQAGVITLQPDVELDVLAVHNKEQTTSSESGQQTRKRRKLQAQCVHLQSAEVLSPQKGQKCVAGIALFVRWTIAGGKQRLTSLPLRRISGVDDLQGTQQELVRRAFPESSRPAHLALSSHEFYHFCPEEDCLSLPNDVVDTTFKLIVTFDGWEYVVLERSLRTPAPDPPESRPMFVSVVEFESTALVIGHLNLRVRLVSYPLVSLRKTFFDEVEDQLINNPCFKGIL